MSDTVTAAPTDEALEAARWNLEPLVDDGGPERALAQLDESQERAEAFAERYRGKLAELGPAEFAEAMRELEAISDLAGRAGTYVSLKFAVDTASPEVGALMQEVQERSAALQTTLLFFELEWNELDDEQAQALIEAPELAFCSHYLKMERRYRPYQLSEPEERILTETSVTGPGAFSRLFTEQTSAITVELSDADEPLQLMEALSRLQDPDRERRAEAAGAVTEALAARPADPSVHLQHAASGQGDQGPAALVRALARLQKPRQRGLRRVGRGADRGGPGSLRARAALVSPEGEDAGAGPPRRLRPGRAAGRSGALHPLRRGPRAGARLLPRLLDRARRDRGGVLHRRLHRRAAGAGQARRGVLLLRGALGAPLRDAQLHLAPRRRADDGPRARPRRSRVALAPAWDL